MQSDRLARHGQLLVLLLKAGGDWNQIVAAACSLADEFGRLLDSGMM